MRTLLITLCLLSSTGCTVVNTVTLPNPAPGDVFVTSGDIAQPHEVLGLIQVQRSGVLLFGLIDVVGTDLEAGFKEALMPEVKKMDDTVARTAFDPQEIPVGVDTALIGAPAFAFLVARRMGAR